MALEDKLDESVCLDSATGDVEAWRLSKLEILGSPVIVASAGRTQGSPLAYPAAARLKRSVSCPREASRSGWIAASPWASSLISATTVGILISPRS